MIGIRKLPSVAGIDGTRKKNTIMTPCIVKSLLYVSADQRSPFGVSSSSADARGEHARRAMKKIVIEIR